MPGLEDPYTMARGCSCGVGRCLAGPLAVGPLSLPRLQVPPLGPGPETVLRPAAPAGPLGRGAVRAAPPAPLSLPLPPLPPRSPSSHARPAPLPTPPPPPRGGACLPRCRQTGRAGLLHGHLGFLRSGTWKSCEKMLQQQQHNVPDRRFAIPCRDTNAAPPMRPRRYILPVNQLRHCAL